MIIILSNPHDSHYLYVKEKIEKFGVDYTLIDFAQFPTEVRLSFELNQISHSNVIINTSGRKISGAEITAVWNRRKGQPIVSPKIESRHIKKYIERESQFLLDALPHLIPVFWLNNPDATSIAARKPYQLLLAQTLGLSTPLTYIGNSHEKAVTFLNLIDEIAVKTLCMPSINIENGETTHNNKSLILYTKKVNKAELASQLSQITNCPTILQNYIEKEFELRITVVGNHVFSCAIYSQMTERTKEDWRRYDIPNTPHKPYQLPIEIEQKCLRLVQELGLTFGCIDMIVTPNGEFIFLEINPNGQWLWIERLSGFPIGETIAKLLINGGV